MGASREKGVSFLTISGRILAGLAGAFVVYILSLEGLIPPGAAPWIYALVVLLVSLWLVGALSGLAVRTLHPTIGDKAYTIGTVIRFFGYIVAAVAALLAVGISPTVALAGGTVTGLVLGLGAQSVLGNFFAGVVVLATGFIRSGDEVRLLTVALPYQAASSPGYKFFSPDYINVGYRGVVLEVGLMYSTLTTDTGLGLKVPNQIILNSAVVDYRPSGSENRQLQVRYEFRITQNPDVVLGKVSEALADLPQVGKATINEQSDKDFYIVQIPFTTPVSTDWSALKSEILRRLIRLDAELRRSSLQ